MATSPLNSASLLFLAGIYSRVARQLGVHPSYVSRVARGERRSDRVSRAIAAELVKFKSPASPDTAAKHASDASRKTAAREMRKRLASSMKSDQRLHRLGATIIDTEVGPNSRKTPRQVSPASLSTRLAANSRLIAITVTNFERISRRLERIPHVLSLLDSQGVVLYSTGTTGMARLEHRVTGVDWSKDVKGISAGARCLTTGVPVAVIGAFAVDGYGVPFARMACPVRLSDHSIAGVLVLTLEVTRAKPDHFLDVCKIARRVCKFVENGPLEKSRKRDTSSRIKPFAEAARHVAMVLSLPQIDPATRASLSGMLADLENGSRRAVLGDPPRRRKSAQAQAHRA